MNDTGYRRIVEAIEEGRRALARARLTAGLLRFFGIALAALGGLVVWAVLQRALHIYSVPLAGALSVLGAGTVVFTAVRWVVVPLIRMPDRDDFVALVEERFPGERNLIVNAFQLGDAGRSTQGAAAPDLVEAVVDRAAERIRSLDLRRWRDPRPDRPFLWAGGGALGAMVLLGALSPSLLGGALRQIVSPRDARPPDVTLSVAPGDADVDRGTDVRVSVEVTGTDRIPTLRFRERNGAWRSREFLAHPGAAAAGERWETVLAEVDRDLEYRVEAPRAESPIYALRVREAPRLTGFRAHLAYPPYTRLPAETVTSGTGDLAVLYGTEVDLRVLLNRSVPAARLEWAVPGKEPRRIELTAVDATTLQARFSAVEPASYEVVLLDETGAERVRSPRFQVDPIPDRAPHLTLHFPLEDHDLSQDMMERIVADAADDFGFSAAQVVYRVDDGEERRVSYTPFTAGQTEFRLDTLWDLSGLDLLPGGVVSYYVEVRDNDAVSGPKATRSPVRQVRFPTVGEIYQEVAEDHDREIDNLSGVQDAQKELDRQLDKLDQDLKRGRELNWEMKQDMEQSVEQQQALESKISEAVGRLRETLGKASDRAQMNQDLLDKMSELNDLLNNLADEDTKRAFQELSRALDKMDRNALREALDKVQLTQDQMLRGMDRTIELLKQIRREEQMEDVVRRTEEIAELESAIAKELDKLAEKTGDKKGADSDQALGDQKESEAGDQTAAEPQTGDQEGAQEGKKAEASENENGKDQEARQGETSEAGDQGKKENAAAEEKAGSQENQDQSEASPNESSPEGAESKPGNPGGRSREEIAKLAQEQASVQERVEELKRVLRALQKLNEDKADMAKKLGELEKSPTTESLSRNMQAAQQGMKSGNPKKAADFAFQARDEANRLANMARNMQEQMAQAQDERSSKMVEQVIVGLIDVSGVQEELASGEERDGREQAARQLSLAEVTEALAETLQTAMRQSFALEDAQQKKLDQALQRMGRATTLFEQGSRDPALHEARETMSDVNETIVELMKAQSQMCNGSSGSASAKMRAMAQGQQSLNGSTRELLERLAGQKRLSMSDEERLSQLAAQQEMIRQGLEEVRQNFSESQKLLGDLDQLGKEMEDVAKDLKAKNADRRLQERQERILSRLLDAQRSVRQQEMSPQRESRTATLAERTSPPPLPAELSRRERTLDEDVLRGSIDRYPPQYRKLVEEYFRALSRESRTP